MAGGFPNVVGAAVYPFRAASTRLRLGLLTSPLEQMGVAFTSWSYLADPELDPWVSGKRIVPAARGLARAVTLLECIRSGSALVVQRECLPWNSLLLETTAARRIPIVWDVDDAMWLSSTGLRSWVRGSESKYSKLAKIATEVWAGSETVASWCVAQGARKVRVVPTVTRIPPFIAEPDLPPRLVWVGTPATLPYLHQVLAANQEAFQEWTIETVGAPPLSFPKLRIESYPWTQANEERALSRAWAGLYPIDTGHQFSAGKSALKAVLMGAYGLPVIATHTASNAAVINHEETGILLPANHGWGEALRFIADRVVRDRMALAARERIEADFNPKIWGKKLASSLAKYVM